MESLCDDAEVRTGEALTVWHRAGNERTMGKMGTRDPKGTELCSNQRRGMFESRTFLGYKMIAKRVLKRGEKSDFSEVSLCMSKFIMF